MPYLCSISKGKRSGIFHILWLCLEGIITAVEISYYRDLLMMCIIGILGMQALKMAKRCNLSLETKPARTFNGAYAEVAMNILWMTNGRH